MLYKHVFWICRYRHVDCRYRHIDECRCPRLGQDRVNFLWAEREHNWRAGSWSITGAFHVKWCQSSTYRQARALSRALFILFSVFQIGSAGFSGELRSLRGTGSVPVAVWWATTAFYLFWTTIITVGFASKFFFYLTYKFFLFFSLPCFKGWGEGGSKQLATWWFATSWVQTTTRV